MTTREHILQPLDEEVAAIGGSYRLVKEERLELEGRQVLYLIGHGVFDNTCCGAGGCGYALVPGFITAWKTATSEEGLAVSGVEPIDDDAVRRRISRMITSRENVQEVRFL
jgi:hypothetical protein